MGDVDRPGLTIGRREALTASTLGIGSLLLPAAGAAASPGTLVFEPSAFTYTTETTIAAWLPFDSADEDAYERQSQTVEAGDGGGEPEVEFEFGPGVVARRVDGDGLTAYLTIGGTRGEDGDPEVTGKPGGSATSPIEPIDLTPSYSEWRMHNSASVNTLETTPHLDFTINVMSGQGDVSGTLTLATLVLHSVSNMSSAPNNAVNLAAYVTAPGESGAVTVLRRTASIPGGVTNRHIVINLGLSGRSFTGGDAVKVRIYPYATDPARDEVRFRRFNSDPAPQPLTGADQLDAARVNAILDESQNWMAAFVGTYVGPPED
jgi:hypothetical protein